MDEAFNDADLEAFLPPWIEAAAEEARSVALGMLRERGRGAVLVGVARVDAALEALLTAALAPPRGSETLFHTDRPLGTFGAKIALDVGQKNAEMARATTFFNNSLLETEISKMLEEEGFSQTQLAKQFAAHKGEVIANQAASGTVIGEGSNADVVASDMAQFEMDKMVLSRNYTDKIGDVLNTMAMNAWEGELQARKFVYQAGIEAVSAVANGQMQAAGSMVQAGLAAGQTQVNSDISAWQTFTQGMWQSRQYEAAGKQAKVSGLIGGVSDEVKVYGAFGGFNNNSSLMTS
jgi:hypothetical protein